MVITLATDRNNPGGNLNYYITNRDYSQVYASNTISVGQRTTYSGSGPYPNSNLTIYNFGPNGISINENNYNFKLAFTFGYGKYDSIVNSNNSNYVANAWGDTTPSKATQTISYIDAETGEPMPDTTSITSSGLTGQTYQIDPRAEKIIKGYYLVNKERDHGVISQYKNGGTYTNEWVSLNGQFVKEVWHQINSSGVMQASIYINNVQQYDPNNPWGIVYPATLSNEGPTELTVSGVSGRYVFPNPYVEQTTNIKLKYATIGKIIPVDPNGNPIPGADQPQFPNDPNDPSKSNPGEKPNVPGWTPEDPNPTVNPSPKGPGENVNVTYVQEAELKTWKKDVSLTVKYVNSDGSQFTGTVPANASQSLNFSGEAYVSKVTGKLVNAKQDAKGQWIVDSSNTATPEITWTPESSSFSEVVSPVEAGYYLKNISSHEAGNNVEAISGITHTSDNVEVTVTYAPLGKMIPVDPSGKPIPDAPTPQFPNNPSDPSKGNPGNKPEVPGWTPVDPSKTVNPDPSDPGKNVPVPYAQVVAGTVTYIDDTTGKTLSTYDIPKGTVGSKINYSTTETINNYEKQGYVLVSNNYPTDAVYKVSGNDYQVHLVEGVQPITPDTPPTDVPTGTPENAQPSALKKDVSLTVKYVNSDGSQFTGTVPANASQSLNFSGEAYVSKVTGKLVNAKQDAKGQWIVDSSNTATPEITWTPESSSFSEVVSPVEAGYYLKNISSHEAGNNVEAISGITHTSDNVEVTVTYAPLGKMIPVDPSGKPIPDAPTPQFPNNPSDPSKGNPGNKPEVPGWTPVDPSKTVNPDPSDPGKNVPVKYVPNTPVQEEGSITVTVHDKTDNVDLPQYGKTSGEQKVGTEFTYDKNSVIQELENKGYKVLNPEVVIPTEITKGNQNIVIEVEHQLVPVTPENPGKPGEPINPNDPNGPKWPAGTDKDSLEKTGTQTIKYVAAGDKTPADNTQSFTFTRSAVVDKVTGKIVSEIGWNETSHTFGEVKTPEVSGYKADKEIAGGATITPDDLHKTIVVIYSPENPTPDTYNGSQTIKFVDPNGNELEPSNVQTATDLTGDHTFGIIDVPVINGYVSPVTTAGGATVTKDNPNAVITVVYTPVGRIIPVDPNGNPIPGQEHPQFPNNPNNPTEVIPGTKPNILGYHPENGKPGDPVNPVPGKPGEDVLVKYVPDTSTPKVPNKSTTPVKPETPAEQPAKSEKPATPSTPEKTNVSNKSEKVENTSINNIASQANKRTEKVVNKKAKTLPKTGAQNNEGVLAGVVGSALALFGLIGLIGDNKRKKKI